MNELDKVFYEFVASIIIPLVASFITNRKTEEKIVFIPT